MFITPYSVFAAVKVMKTQQLILTKKHYPFYIGLNVGYSEVHYTNGTLLNDITADDISRGGLAERPFLGFNFNRYLATELSVIYIQKPNFRGIMGSKREEKIKHNIISLVGRINLPLNSRFSINGKAGIGYIVRNGLRFNGVDALEEGEFFTPVWGVGGAMVVNQRISVDATWMSTPANTRHQLPPANYYGIGAYFKFCF